MHADYYFKLHKQYPEFTLNVELQLNKGEFFSLLGPSGCGKTTLLRLIAGLEDNPSGSIQIDGEELIHIPPAERQIGMVFQDYALFPHLTVIENISYGLKARHLPVREIHRKVEVMLELFELSSLKNRSIHQLSGGEKQRVALARSLIIEPRILLLDEPFSALDYNLRARLRRELRDYQKRLGFTTIFVTHQQEEALMLSDRMGLMQQGRLLQYGTPEVLYQNPVNRFVAEFLGETNFIPVIPVDSRTVQLLIGEYRLPFQLSSPDRKTGQVMVRPENITIHESTAYPISFSARLIRDDYMGYMRRLEADAYGKRFIIYSHPSLPIPGIGDEMILGISPERLQWIPDSVE
ncbi:MAG TPA: ABC transporter ATP-binding protein [Bacillota bacterium]|nr:ABC transporter ATP-binding protein [Bacillota bacterium]HPT88582.1 ABC transporter ATP-binding protein [Bacillota bacterium]